MAPPTPRSSLAETGGAVLGLGGLASAAGSEAVLPAYLIGLATAGVFLGDRVLMDRKLVDWFGWPTEAAHQLLEQLARLGVGHQLLLHLLRRAPDLRVGHEALGHGLEASRHVLHRALLRHLEQDRLARGRHHRLGLGTDHLDPFAPQALALQAAVAELRA